jgi:hypothetical protein
MKEILGDRVPDCSCAGELSAEGRLFREEMVLVAHADDVDVAGKMGFGSPEERLHRMIIL